MTYAVKLVAATRDPRKAGLRDHGRFILYGASPRATIGLIEAGRALAYLRGRDYVLPADVVDIAADVLRHRVVPSYEALAEGITADKLVRRHHARRARAGESAGQPCRRKRLRPSCAAWT